MNEINLDTDGLMRQAVLTADYYLAKAYDILKRDYEDCTVKDAIELSKVIAQDFHTALMAVKMQEIRDAINNQTNEMS